MWSGFLAAVAKYKLGDLASIAGVVISLFGFGVTLFGVFRSKGAAQRAEMAARSALESVRTFEVVVDFTSTIAMLEELKRAHRAGQWAILPDRYAAIRKLLINVRASKMCLTERQSTVIQGALSTLQLAEQTVDRALAAGQAADPAKLNKVLSKDIDDLLVVLGEIKTANTGG